MLMENNPRLVTFVFSRLIPLACEESRQVQTY